MSQPSAPPAAAGDNVVRVDEVRPPPAAAGHIPDVWYISDQTGQVGPLSLDELKDTLATLPSSLTATAAMIIPFNLILQPLGHPGFANAATLPRPLTCSHCGHRSVVRPWTAVRSPAVARDEQAAERAAAARLAMQ